jgi:hypothetical protein
MKNRYTRTREIYAIYSKRARRLYTLRERNTILYSSRPTEYCLWRRFTVTHTVQPLVVGISHIRNEHTNQLFVAGTQHSHDETHQSTHLPIAKNDDDPHLRHNRGMGGDISSHYWDSGYMGGHVMLPNTALVIFETDFGHRLLSVKRWTVKCQQWGVQRNKNFTRSAREIILYPHFKYYGAAPDDPPTTTAYSNAMTAASLMSVHLLIDLSRWKDL